MGEATAARKKRAPNFTEQEASKLVRLVLSHIDVVEDKKTDSEKWKQKEMVWQKIAQVFNATAGTTVRTPEALRQKYDCIKKALKKKISKNRQETFKTGGGVPNYEKILEYEKDLLEHISVTTNGLPSLDDSDAVLPVTNLVGERTDPTDEELLTSAAEVEAVLVEELLFDVEPHLDENDQPSTCLPSNENVATNSTTVTPITPARKSVKSNKTWETWSPAALKDHKHPVLTLKAKKPPPRVVMNAKLEVVTQSRAELLEIQQQVAKQDLALKQNEQELALSKHQSEEEIKGLTKEYIKNKERRDQIEHEKRMELLQLQIEEKRIDILLKKKQLEN